MSFEHIIGNKVLSIKTLARRSKMKIRHCMAEVYKQIKEGILIKVDPISIGSHKYYNNHFLISRNSFHQNSNS